MVAPVFPTDASARLSGFYNGLAYSDANLGGFDAGGHRVNLIAALRDVASVGAYFGAQASTLAAAYTMIQAGGPVATVNGKSGPNIVLSASDVGAVTSVALDTFTPAAGYAMAATDRGRVLALSGSSTLHLPNLSSVDANFYFHVLKRDGSGSWTITSDQAGVTIDGLTTITVYQENFTLIRDGANWRTLHRPKGWIPMQTFTVTGSPTQIALALGFGDTEIQDLEFHLRSLKFAAAGSLYLAVGKLLTENYSRMTTRVSGTTITAETSADTGSMLLGAIASGAAWSGSVNLKNIGASALYYPKIAASMKGDNLTSSFTTTAETTYYAGPATGLTISTGGVVLSSGSLYQMGYRK